MERSIKKKAINLKGGCCVLCGYNTCISALHFHHVNSFEKEFSISSQNNWKEIEDELNKCILLCANCHAEVHEGKIDLEYLLDLDPNFNQFCRF
jgi:hypothetical protein